MLSWNHPRHPLPLQLVPSNWSPRIKIKIPQNRQQAILEASRISTPIVIYTDGSGHLGGIGAAAVIYHSGELTHYSQYYLRTTVNHMVYEGELVGMLLGISMLLQVERTIEVVVGVDSQAAIKATKNSSSQPGCHLLRTIHECVQQVLESSPNTTITIQWTPGHEGIEGNEQSDQQAKSAAAGNTTSNTVHPIPLPLLPEGYLPTSHSASVTAFNATLKQKAATDLTRSPRYHRLKRIDNSFPHPRFMQLVPKLPR